jgi:hypothetical protein
MTAAERVRKADAAIMLAPSIGLRPLQAAVAEANWTKERNSAVEALDAALSSLRAAGGGR